MTDQPTRAFSRRIFLQQGLTLASMAMTAPLFIERSARAMMMPLGSPVSSRPGVPEDRVLVIVQLGGGNDGLNTVVPYFAGEYYNARPWLAVPEPGRGEGAIPLDDGSGVGLHPAFSAFKDLLADGAASIIQGVGYPNPNRSHFTSMDIWQTGRTTGRGDGWVGRFFDNTCEGAPDPQAAVAIGRRAPLALIGRTQQPVNVESAEHLRWLGGDVEPSLSEPYAQVTRGGLPEDVSPESHVGFLARTAMDAQLSSDRIVRALGRDSLVSYPSNPLARQLEMVSAMIRDELPTRVYYVALGGFDTHAAQPGPHAILLARLAESLKAFQRDLAKQGNDNRVLTMVFSEFGRRVAQNASNGTDHGAAAPMFLVGGMVRPGLLGQHPSLSDLDQGDLRYNVDFRSVYAAILEDWMGAEAAPVLGGGFPKPRIFRQPG